MANLEDIPTLRYLLSQFIKDDRTIKAFESLGDVSKEGYVTAQAAYDLATVAKAVADAALALAQLLQLAEYVTLSADGTLDNERVLTQGNLIKLTDGGPGGNITVAVDKLSIGGAFTVALTLTGNTAVTLPTTGTLATRAGIETLTNKTLDTLRVQDAVTASAPVAAGTIPVLTASGVRYMMLSATP